MSTCQIAMKIFNTKLSNHNDVWEWTKNIENMCLKIKLTYYKIAGKKHIKKSIFSKGDFFFFAKYF